MTQASILQPAKKHGWYLEFDLRDAQDTGKIRDAISSNEFQDQQIIGYGPRVCDLLGVSVAGLHDFKSIKNGLVSVPSTQHDLLVFVEDDEPGVAALNARKLQKALSDYFELIATHIGFVHYDGHDLTGYEDGTENPEGDDAAEAVKFISDDPNLNGGCFATIQRWVHDLETFSSKPQQDQDHIIGRRLSDNEELDDAPISAHTKRTAQESFEPEAFMLRRSMPWVDQSGAGLIFTAFASSLYPFEAQMDRMAGVEDGVTDGLFEFSTPVSGSHYWCPPQK